MGQPSLVFSPCPAFRFFAGEEKLGVAWELGYGQLASICEYYRISRLYTGM